MFQPVIPPYSIQNVSAACEKLKKRMKKEHVLASLSKHEEFISRSKATKIKQNRARAERIKLERTHKGKWNE